MEGRNGVRSKYVAFSWVAAATLVVGLVGYLSWSRSESRPLSTPVGIDQRLAQRKASNVASENVGSPPISKSAKAGSSSHPLIVQAVALIDRGDISGGERLLKELIAADPKNTEAWVELGMIELIDRASPFLAVEYLKQAWLIKPDKTALLNEIDSIFESLSAWSKGEKFFQGLSQSAPGNEHLMFYLGKYQYHTGRPKDALVTLEKMPRDGGFEVNRLELVATIQAGSGRTSLAIETLAAAVQKASDQARLLMKTGGQYGHYGPKISQMKFKLAKLYMDIERWEDAERVLSEAILMNPNDPKLLNMMNRVRAASSAG